MSDLISRQEAIEEVRKMAIALYGYDATAVISCAIYKLQNLQSSQPSEDTQAAFEQGRIQGHVEMQTELLMQLKEIVGDEVWANI